MQAPMVGLLLLLCLAHVASSQSAGRKRDRGRRVQESKKVQNTYGDDKGKNLTTRAQLQAVLEKRKSKYDESILPDNPLLNVTVGLKVYCIFGLDDKEVMEMSGWLTITWFDFRFQWEPEEWDYISILEMSTDNLWLPDVGIWNAKEPENADLRAKPVRTVVVSPAGKLVVYLPILINIPCPIESILFPFDQQVCALSVGTVSSPRRYYRLLVSEVNFDNAKKVHVGEWKPIGYRQTLTTAFNNATGTTFDVYQIDIILNRKPLYHIVLVIIPFVLLTVIALVMFLAQEAGDRVSISIAIVLAMTLYVMITSQNAPKSMTDIPLLGMYLMIQMSLLIFFTFMAVISAIAPSMVEESEGANGKTMWHRVKEKRRLLDIVGFVLYLTSTCINSAICLVAIPHLEPKLTK